MLGVNLTQSRRSDNSSESDEPIVKILATQGVLEVRFSDLFQRKCEIDLKPRHRDFYCHPLLAAWRLAEDDPVAMLTPAMMCVLPFRVDDRPLANLYDAIACGESGVLPRADQI